MTEPGTVITVRSDESRPDVKFWWLQTTDLDSAVEKAADYLAEADELHSPSVRAIDIVGVHNAKPTPIPSLPRASARSRRKQRS